MNIFLGRKWETCLVRNNELKHKNLWDIKAFKTKLFEELYSCLEVVDGKDSLINRKLVKVMRKTKKLNSESIANKFLVDMKRKELEFWLKKAIKEYEDYFFPLDPYVKKVKERMNILIAEKDLKEKIESELGWKKLKMRKMK